MLSKNWQQKADGSDVNWGEVQPRLTPFLFHKLFPSSMRHFVTGEYSQVPNGDADYDDGGD